MKIRSKFPLWMLAIVMSVLSITALPAEEFLNSETSISNQNTQIQHFQAPDAWWRHRWWRHPWRWRPWRRW